MLIRVHPWFCFLLFLGPVAIAGTITGTVTAQGKAGADEAAAGGKYDSKKLKFAPRVDYSQLKDFVVYIDQAVGTGPVPTKLERVVVQKDAVFRPHVLPVAVGSIVEWPNEDEIFHNVFSFSDPKSFDLGLYKDDTKRVTFDQTGRVDVFCSIHKDMHCIILVLPSPYFTMVDAGGHFSITNVPAGTYRLKAWHERLPPQTVNVTVPEQGGVTNDFVMGITGLPQY